MRRSSAVSGEDRGLALCVGFGITERPWLFSGQILVSCGDNAPERFEGTGEIQVFKIVEDIADGSLCFARERFVLPFEFPGFWNFTGEIFFNHGRGAAGKIPKTVGKVAVVARDQCVVTEIPVLAEDDFAQQKITESVHTKHVGDGPWENYIAFGFGHFAGVHQKPAVRPDLFGDREHGGHQECGPVHGVEADNVFSDQMQIGGPHAALFVVRTADGAEIGGERVKPDVKNVRLFAGNGNAPTNGGAGDTKIFQAAFDKADDFVFAAFRLNKLGILFIEIKQRFLECGKLEEIVFFGEGFGGAAAVGTIVTGLSVVHKSVVVDAVLAGVVAFVDVAVFAAKFEEPLHGAHVLKIRGTNEFVGRNAEFEPQCAPGVSHFGYEFGFGDTGFFSGAFDIDAVFVGAGSHDHLVAAHTFVAADDIGDDGGVGVADVRQAIGVVDRRRQVEFCFSGHF